MKLFDPHIPFQISVTNLEVLCFSKYFTNSIDRVAEIVKKLDVWETAETLLRELDGR
jgi:hypothetical protein